MHFDLFIYVEKKIEENGTIKRKLVSLKLVYEGKTIDLIDNNGNLNYQVLPEKIKEEFILKDV